MTSLLDAPRGSLVPEGVQTPRFESFPPFASSAGEEALEVARLAGLHLDPWQERVLCAALNERLDGKWAAFEVGLIVSRQNGKGAILEARELAGLFLLGERFIVHSAHQYDTSIEAFRRLLGLIEGVPEFDRRIKRISYAHAGEGIELKNGQRIRFRTRTKGGGRGFTGDCLILDEAMELPESAHGALLPTLSARPNPQVWYTGSAVDQEVQANGIVLARIRERGIRGGDESLAFFEWSADLDVGRVTAEKASDPTNWAHANPALGIRITSEHVGHEFASMDPRTFAVERLGVGDWPSTDSSGRAIPLDVWEKVCDPTVKATAAVFAVDVNPERNAAAIVAVGTGPKLELVDYRAGTSWIVDRCVELQKKYRAKFAVAKTGPVGSFIEEFGRERVRLIELDSTEMVRAAEFFYDQVIHGKVQIRTNEFLDTAAAGAVKRPVGDAWTWDRKNSRLDISPIVACSAGLWAHANRSKSKVVSLAEALAAEEARLAEES